MVVSRPQRFLRDNQFYPAKYKKKFIFLHHTAGGSAQSTIDWWNTHPDHVATPYIVDRDGTIWELFNPDYWAYALGVTGATIIEKASIHIELVAYGWLARKDNGFIWQPQPNQIRAVPFVETENYSKPWRGHFHYHAYTEPQIKSLKVLLEYLAERYNISLENDYNTFYEYQPNFMARITKGVWSHTSIRKDKSDIHPQPELLAMLNSLKKAK